jgi:hypothetical protein
MTGRRLLRVQAIAAALALAGVAHAENAAFVIPFGGEPGAPLAHAYDYGKPPITTGTYAMRVPSVDTAVQSVFPDVELTIDATTKTVLRSHAERAYRALTECTAALQTVQPKLAVALPQPYTGTDPAWQAQSADGKVIGGAYCRTERYLPFPILILDLTTPP